MGVLFLIILIATCTALVSYQTIKGYRTGVLKIRSQIIDRRMSPRLYAINLTVLAILALVMLGSLVLVIYGETHPEWRRAHAKHAAVHDLKPFRS